MGTFLEFYKVDKNKISSNALKYLKLDQCESDEASDEGVSFFDLTLDMDYPDIEQLNRFPRTGLIRRVINAFMRSKGITDEIYNTSMVMSKSLVSELLVHLSTSPLWDPEEFFFTAGEKECTMAFFQDILDTHDFDNEYFFYTYY